MCTVLHFSLALEDHVLFQASIQEGEGNIFWRIVTIETISVTTSERGQELNEPSDLE